jgi:tetratricopeptide (TPR) repeat protein
MRWTARRDVILVLTVVLSCRMSITAAPGRQDFAGELYRAQSFYRANQLQESLILLTELERRIGADPQRKNELVNIKVYLALTHMGLKENEQAKSKFIEVCMLDSGHELNPKDAPAQAVALYNDARASCPPPPRPAATANMSIMETTFLRGKELYDKNQFTDALKYFNVVLALDSSHELARAYSDLIQARLAVLADGAYLEWRSSFDARQFDKAAAAYTRIAVDQQLGEKLAAQIASEYEKALSESVSSWRVACEAGNLNKLDSIWNDALALAPGLQFSRDAVSKMQPCLSAADGPIARSNPPNSTRPSTTLPGVTSSPATSVAPPGPVRPPASPPNAAPTPGPGRPTASTAPPPSVQPAVPAPPAQVPIECMQGDPLLAMSRLKTRVNPQIEPGLQRYIGRGIVVSIRVDEQGNVSVKDIAKANPRIAEALKWAVEQWKFTPAVIGNRARCVDTDLPITLIQP